MPPRKQAAEAAIDIESEVRKKIETGSKVAPAPDEEEQARGMSPERDVIDRERLPAPPQNRARVLRFSPVLRVRLPQRRDAHAPGWCSSTDIVYTVPAAALLVKAGRPPAAALGRGRRGRPVMKRASRPSARGSMV